MWHFIEGGVQQSGLPLIAAVTLGGYMLGSIPFGVIVGRWAAAVDPRRGGSGNIGATNILRLVGAKAAAVTLTLDCAKSALAVLLAMNLPATSPAAVALAALACVLGHCFPPWLRFRGGRGVSAYLGCLAALSPLVALVGIALWTAAFLLTRFSSIASLTATLAVATIAALMGDETLTLFSAGATLIVYVRHTDNLRRLVRGEELRFTKRG